MSTDPDRPEIHASKDRVDPRKRPASGGLSEQAATFRERPRLLHIERSIVNPETGD